jgi:formate dehydrogenase major subunit
MEGRMRGDAGARALALIDKLLAERPEKVGHDFSEATRCITTLRDEMIARYRAGTLPRRELDDINAVLSVIMGGHFPLGAVPWEKIATARARLARLTGA